jgi:hypothetical protein
MTQTQAERLARARWGPAVVLECHAWVLPTTGLRVVLCYARVGDRLVAVGRDWAHLLD